MPASDPGSPRCYNRQVEIGSYRGKARRAYGARRPIGAQLFVMAMLFAVAAGARQLPLRGEKSRAHPAYNIQALRLPETKTKALREVAGSQQLLVFVIKSTSCAVCRRQLQQLQRYHQRFAQTDTRIVVLGSQNIANLVRLKRAAKLRFRLASDPSRRVLRKLGLWREAWEHPLPAMLLFDRCGRERGRVAGRRPGMEPEQAFLRLSKKVRAEATPCQPVARAARPPSVAQPRE
jgi:peroxiredoxin